MNAKMDTTSEVPIPASARGCTLAFLVSSILFSTFLIRSSCAE